MRQYDQSHVREHEILSDTAPWLFGLLIIECIICKLKRKKAYRLNDTINRYNMNSLTLLDIIITNYLIIVYRMD